jgi:hypothetical protein
MSLTDHTVTQGGNRGIDSVNLSDIMAGLLNFFECVYMDYQNWTSSHGQT